MVTFWSFHEKKTLNKQKQKGYFKQLKIFQLTQNKIMDKGINYDFLAEDLESRICSYEISEHVHYLPKSY